MVAPRRTDAPPAFFPDYTSPELAGIATRGAQLAAEAAELFPGFGAVKMRLSYSCTLEAPAALGGAQIVVHFDVAAPDELISDLLNDAVEGLAAAAEGPVRADEVARRVRRPPPSSADSPLSARIIDLLHAGPLTNSAIANALKRSRADVAAALTTLLADGAIDTAAVVVRGRRCEAFALTADATADDNGRDAGSASSAPASDPSAVRRHTTQADLRVDVGGPWERAAGIGSPREPDGRTRNGSA